jgi:hypothetical protein
MHNDNIIHVAKQKLCRIIIENSHCQCKYQYKKQKMGNSVKSCTFQLPENENIVQLRHQGC